MVANLHLHSRYSDGSLWPEELAPRAVAKGVEYAALTDHDTLAGTAEFLAAAGASGLAAVAGCEIDCEAREIGYRSEILAYFPGGAWDSTSLFLEGLAKERAARVYAYMESARILFDRPDLSFDDLVSAKYGDRAFRVAPFKATLSKVDFWLYLRRRGLAEAEADYRSFRKEWLDTERISGPKGRHATVEEVAAVVRKDGGLLVLPHFGHEFEDSHSSLLSDRKRFVRMLEYFRDAGLAGIELYHYRNDDAGAINAEVAAEASRLGLFLTYGSDCHGPGSGKDTLGDFAGEFPGFPGFPPPRRVSNKE